MSEDNKALKALLDGISLMIDEKLKLAGFDRSVIGFITGANLENNTYTVQINGYEYVNVKSVIGNLGTMTPCICTIPQNQMSQMYISGIVDNTNYIDGGGGGTGGNYNDLQNKPSINGVTLSGNKTTSDLGISQPTKTSQLTNDSNFVVDTNYVHTDNNFTNALLSKLNGIEDGADVNLIEKITVNGVEQTISSKTVALTVMTNAVNDLVNYYTKSETYTKTEVNGLISAIPKFAIEVVNSLPTTDISTTTIYLLRNSETTGSDLFEEYIYVNNAWELLGAQTIDLSNYVTTSDLNTALASYVTSTSLATTLLGYVTTTTWNTLGAVATSNDYNDLNNKPTIPTVYDGTLTLKLNGVTAGSFSANQSQNEEIDLIVGGGGGGHTILNSSQIAVTQRPDMWFKDAKVSDDGTNDSTNIEMIQVVTKSQFDNLPTDGSADGVYVFGDGQGGSGIDADNVTFNNTGTTIQSTNVGDAIRELNADLGIYRLNKLESVVNLDSYNSASNPYTFPSDGYACTASGSNVSLYVYGSNGNTSYSGAIKGDAMLFVRKGMKCHTVGTGTPWFLPLT